MAKLTAWLVTLIGVLLVLSAAGYSGLAEWNTWIIAIAVLVIGLGKLARNYKVFKNKR